MVNEEKRIKLAREYIKKNLWKRIGKYKLIELVVIPFLALGLWKIPTWIGWGIIKLFNIPVTNYWFCQDTGADTTKRICDNLNYSTISIWGVGFIFLMLLGMFILINLIIAKNNIEDEAMEKYDISWGDLR